MKAWLTKLMGEHSLVWANTRGEAKFATSRAAREAGYQVKFFDVRVQRMPTLDGEPGREPMRCYAVKDSY